MAVDESALNKDELAVDSSSPYVLSYDEELLALEAVDSEQVLLDLRFKQLH